MNRIGLIAAGFLAAVSCFQVKAQQPAFALHQDDRIVFYGDSITEQRFYTWWTELYADTRFPKLHLRFWNAGVGGDRVSGGGGGEVDLRLARDVYAYHPSVVTIMLGMNDGRYASLTPDVDQAYKSGYEHILQSIKQHETGARILSIGPSPYDEVTRTQELIPGGYNATLLHFGQVDQQLAAQYGSVFTDANNPFTAALRRAAAEDKLAAQMLVPDRVHPELYAHMLIAMAVLDAWNAPSLVSSTVIDAKQLVSDGSSGVSIRSLSREDSGVSWRSEEDALPLALVEQNASIQYMKRICDVVARLNREPLVVRNLPNGDYALKIDDMEIGKYSSAALAAGINLAEMDTPMRRQSQSVGWIIRDKGDLQYVRMRALIRDPASQAVSSLDKTEAEMQQAIWDGATPLPHQFRLVPVKP
jgi:lysophospholipase L1-like esterase